MWRNLMIYHRWETWAVKWGHRVTQRNKTCKSWRYIRKSNEIKKKFSSPAPCFPQWLISLWESQKQDIKAIFLHVYCSQKLLLRDGVLQNLDAMISPSKEERSWSQLPLELPATWCATWDVKCTSNIQAARFCGLSYPQFPLCTLQKTSCTSQCLKRERCPPQVVLLVMTDSRVQCSSLFLS